MTKAKPRSIFRPLTFLKATAKAFTLLELLVTLLISALVLSTAFYAYSLFSDKIRDFRDEQLEMARLMELNQFLSHNFQTASRIQSPSPHQLKFARDNGTNTEIAFHKEFAVLKHRERDTLVTTVDSEGLQFIDNESRHVHGLTIRIPFRGTSVRINYQKQYSASEHLKLISWGSR